MTPNEHPSAEAAVRNAAMRVRLTPWAMAARLALAACALAATSGPVHAQAAALATRSYDLPAGPLAEALSRFAQQSGVAIVMDAGKLAGLRAQPLKGSFGVEEGFARLLRGSGYSIGKTAAGYVLITDTQTAQQPDAAGLEMTLPAVKVSAAPQQETAVSPVLGYKATRSATATRIDVALQDQPVSVKVIPAEVIADLGVRNGTEVADYVAGVARESTAYSPNSQSFFIRGFSSYGSAATLNGFRQDGFMSATDTSAVERIEFLKGPAAVLYGASSAISGIANTVTKRPTADAFTSIDLSGGQFGYARAAIDANHALGSDALLGRINIAAERDDGFRDYPGRRTNTLFAITPIISARLSADTRAELELSAVHSRFGGRCDYIRPVPELLALSIRKEVICDDLAHANTQTYSARAEVEHQLSERWSVRAAGFFGRTNSERTEQYPANNPFISADGRTIERITQFVSSYATNKAGQLEIRGNFATGGIKHRLIAGMDVTDYYTPYAFFVAPATPMDIVDTRYDGQQLGPYAPDGPEQFNGAKARALYVQDFIELGAQWKLLLGLRHDRVKSQYGETASGLLYNQQTESANSPRVGLVYQPVPSTSIYASWAKSFAPNYFGRAQDGSAFTAERGVQYELGVKQDLLDQRLNVTASVFDLTRSNVLTEDPNDPTGNFSIATGEQRSRGFELDAVGQPTSAWQVIGAYTYLDAKVTEDNTIPVGSKLVGAARHSGSVWNKLSLGAWSMPAWSVGFGIVASGDRQTRLPNIAITLGSYVRYDAGVFYAAGPWRAQLNVKNLTNEVIFVGQGSSLVPQTPRAVTASVGYTF